jgi:hypothetical protein
VVKTAAPSQGTRIDAYRGVWTDNPTSYHFQWVRCDADGTSNCADIAGRTESAYTPVGADVGRALRVRVNATNASGDSEPAVSAATSAVASARPALVQAPVVKRAASPVTGTRLDAYRGEWTNSPTGYRFQWRRCDSGGGSCIDIAGRTKSAYTPDQVDVGHRLVIRVIAFNAAGDSLPATSAPTGVVAAA